MRSSRRTGFRPTSAGRAGSVMARALGHHPADEILLFRHYLAKPEIGGGGLAVKLVAGGVGLLDAHHSQRLGAIEGRWPRAAAAPALRHGGSAR
jgi:hypothetical protein